MNSGIIFEQPLNERMRTLLRLEHLFRLTDHEMKGANQWDTRIALNTLLDIVDLVSRADIKGELIKELERHGATFKALKANPGVDLKRLDQVLDDINARLAELRDKNYQPGFTIKQNELVTAVRQRNAILGGSCNFDLPSYHLWLNRPLEVRRQSLKYWREDLETISKSTFLLLNLIRNSSNPTLEKAENGLFQKNLEQGNACLLIRIVMPEETYCFPEISGGKHRFTVRFMEQRDTANRPAPVDADVEFELHCCMI